MVEQDSERGSMTIVDVRDHQTLASNKLSMRINGSLLEVTLPEWLTGSPAIAAVSGWALPASVRIAQVTLFVLPGVAFIFAIVPEGASSSLKTRPAEAPALVENRCACCTCWILGA